MNSIKDLGSKIIYNVKNARMIEIYSNCENVEENIKNKEIISITIDNRIIAIGDEFHTGLEKIPSTYKITNIKHGVSKTSLYSHNYTLYSHLRNKVTTYILPCLMLENKHNKNFFFEDSYFINAYLNKDLTDIILEYRFAKSDVYANLENNIINHSCYKSVYSKNGFDYFIMCIPSKYKFDVKHICDGKYSKISNDLKDKIKSFNNLSNKSRVVQVLNKDTELIKQMEREFMCSFDGIELESKLNENDFIN